MQGEAREVDEVDSIFTPLLSEYVKGRVRRDTRPAREKKGSERGTGHEKEGRNDGLATLEPLKERTETR